MTALSAVIASKAIPARPMFFNIVSPLDGVVCITDPLPMSVSPDAILGTGRAPIMRKESEKSILPTACGTVLSRLAWKLWELGGSVSHALMTGRIGGV